MLAKRFVSDKNQGGSKASEKSHSDEKKNRTETFRSPSTLAIIKNFVQRRVRTHLTSFPATVKPAVTTRTSDGSS